ncbi:MAG: ATP-binding cassette domain-containing protein [Chitinophagaceae bacterium]
MPDFTDMSNNFLELQQVGVTLGGKKVLQNITLTIQEGQQWAITGPSGSGKTVLAHTIAGKHFYSGHIIASFDTPETYHHSVMMLEQQHRFTDRTNRQDFYYQQRFNSFDAEQTVTVQEELARYLEGVETVAGMPVDNLPQLLQIDHILHEPLIQLSNGENKRVQLAKALLLQPRLLILDHPFTGLDVKGRQLLHTILDTLSANNVRLILITSAHEIPVSITHVATLEQGTLVAAVERKDYQPPATTVQLPFSIEQLKKMPAGIEADFTAAVKMVNVYVRYEGKEVLSNINWEVKRGERWSLSGPNGAGKSTLLSLINGDNPQAYSNEIYLFDRRRGSGESIWDIKRNIGYISPELHLYFDYTSTCFQAVASGLFDTIGLFRTLNEDQEQQVLKWMDLFKLTSHRRTLLANLSASEQRLVLLARALVKNPPLLILDEPCQGLDEEQRAAFKEIINMLSLHFNNTLIYVSHYKEDIPACVTRHLQLEKGAATIS